MSKQREGKYLQNTREQTGARISLQNSLTGFIVDQNVDVKCGLMSMHSRGDIRKPEFWVKQTFYKCGYRRASATSSKRGAGEGETYICKYSICNMGRGHFLLLLGATMIL